MALVIRRPPYQQLEATGIRVSVLRVTMTWVSQRTTSDHRAIVMTPEQAFRAGVIPPNWKGRLGFHNFRHSLATALVKLKVDPKTVQGLLRHEDFGTTMKLYAQADMESMRRCPRKVP